MAFPDFPFKDNEKSFLHHTDVKQYLIDYCEHFGLKELIEFNTKVVEVRPVEGEDRKTTWRVTSEDVANGGTQTRWDSSWKG
jgi:cation diffusion facilitator CzcD-associated flavoprotein CzcO